MQKSTTSYQAYYKTHVQTADQLALIIMLYEGTVRFLKKAKAKIEEGDIEASHNYLMRAKDIISELLVTLKLESGGEIAKNLRELYLYCFRRIVEANLRKDTEAIEDVIKVMNNLLLGWNQVREQQKQTAFAEELAKRKLKIQG